MPTLDSFVRELSEDDSGREELSYSSYVFEKAENVGLDEIVSARSDSCSICISSYSTVSVVVNCRFQPRFHLTQVVVHERRD